MKPDEFCSDCINFRQPGACPLADIMKVIKQQWTEEDLVVHIQFQVLDCDYYMPKDGFSLIVEKHTATLTIGGDKTNGKATEDHRSRSAPRPDSDKPDTADRQC